MSNNVNLSSGADINVRLASMSKSINEAAHDASHWGPVPKFFGLGMSDADKAMMKAQQFMDQFGDQLLAEMNRAHSAIASPSTRGE